MIITSELKRIILNIGDVVVTTEPSILETVLGSCVSVCLWDERLKIGGMNHFMLPRVFNTMKNGTCCGPESMEKLISTFMASGASIKDIKAKIFGGGKVISCFGQAYDVGIENVTVAKKMLLDYGIPIVGECTGLDLGRKIVFYSATGRVFVRSFRGRDELLH
ncbi:MAG: chemotaxis protein CheD [Nitrospirae bacterium]|nr:chemotaxis protein CheD [Nitrospirota bacterium]